MRPKSEDTGLVVPVRFRGPASSGNGGWTCGALAARLGGAAPVRVVLRAKPPLEVPMTVEPADGRLVATHNGAVVAEAAVADHDPVPVPPVDAAEAAAAEASYAGLRSHPFPTCFSCGTGREPGDGLRIFPGRVADVASAADETAERFARVAATWTPHESVAEAGRAALPVTWAALDCVGGWAGDLAERLIVLGTMTTRVHRLPRAGERHVVVGAARGTSGRRILTASSLYGAAGELVATAEHVWVGVDPAAFNSA